MIVVRCGEMTFDEQLALASAISDGLAGRGVALVKDDSIVIDQMASIAVDEVVKLVGDFASKRKDASHYSVEADGDAISVHTPDPLVRSRGRRDTGQVLPENLLKCPWCGFVTQYQELYVVHVRSHGFGA